MAKKSPGKKRIPVKSRHIRWNWERSPDNLEMVRYHVVSVNDRRIEVPFENLYGQLNKYNSGIEIVRQMPQGRVLGTKLHYLFKSFDSLTSPKLIDWGKVGSNVLRDVDLYERKRGSVEDYIERLFG